MSALRWDPAHTATRLERWKKAFHAREVATLPAKLGSWAPHLDKWVLSGTSPQQVQALVAADVPVHVCETHAGWYGVTAEDFPDYVNVAPTGPGQVRLYEELGYDLIVVD